MSQAYRVFISDTDASLLDFETSSEVEPYSKMNDERLIAPPNSESEAIAASVGISFDPSGFISDFISNKKLATAAKSILSYLNGNVDSTVLRFTQDGRIFYQGKAVPGAHLKRVLESVGSKGSKSLEIGEYFLLSNLTNAPDYVKSLVNASKLKLCNIKVDSQASIRKLQRPPKALRPPGPSPLVKTNFEIKSAIPNVFRPSKGTLLGGVVKSKARPDMSVKLPTSVQRRFNVPSRPWYKIA